MNKIVNISLLFLTLLSCSKEEVSEPIEPISATPEIELISVSASNINQFDDLVFTIKYTDGDGNLGNEDADINSIFVTDNRNNILHEFHLQPLAPTGANITIQGNLLIHLENVILLDQSNNTETTTFSIKIKDRAGNESNTVTTGAIVINA